MRKLIIKNKLNESNDELVLDVQHWADDRILIFAKKNNQGCGYIEITPLAEKKKTVYVQQIMVAQEFQRQKIGTKLYERAVLESAKKGYIFFCSDQVRTEESDAFWKKQLQKAEKNEFFKKRLTREKVLNDEYSLDGYRYCLNISGITQVDLSEDL